MSILSLYLPLIKKILPLGPLWILSQYKRNVNIDPIPISMKMLNINTWLICEMGHISTTFKRIYK
jgi:hypothetical protein